MFEVHKSWLVPIPPIFGNNDREAYKCIRLVLNTYYFITEFTVSYEDGGKCIETIMVNSIYDAIAAVQELEDCKLSLFAPRYRNKNNEMSISTIIEVIECHEMVNDNGDKQIAHIYKCKNGETYIESNLGCDENELIDKKLIYWQQ